VQPAEAVSSSSSLQLAVIAILVFPSVMILASLYKFDLHESPKKPPKKNEKRGKSKHKQ
jgi:hypothetical protein